MFRSLALASVVTLTLSACGAPEPADAPPAPAAPDSREPSAEAPTATPAAANVLTAEGLGEMRIGMTLAELTAAVGPDANPDQVGGAEPGVCDEFHPARAPEGVNVMILDGRLARITLLRPAAIKTDQGLGPGDTAARVKEAYGTRLVAQPHKYSPAPAEDLFAWTRGGSADYVVDPVARGIRYEVNAEGRVQMIHAGGPAIQLVEGCA